MQKLCFKHNVLRVKMKFDWDIGGPVGVKGLKYLFIGFLKI